MEESLEASIARIEASIAHIEATIQLHAAAVEKDPVNRDLWNQYGQALFEAGRNQDAIGSFKCAIELASAGTSQLAPKDIAGDWVRLGRALDMAGDVSGAVSSFRRAAGIDPTNAEVVKREFLMARQLYETGMYDESDALYCAIIRRLPRLQPAIDPVLRVLRRHRPRSCGILSASAQVRNRYTALHDPVNYPGEGAWTFSQQSALDNALFKVPSSNFATPRDRWKAVANLVPGRSMKACVLRYR